MIALLLAATINCGANANQMQLDQCAATGLNDAVAAEREAYASASKQFAPNLSALRASETAWRASRDATCAFYTTLVKGGSIEPMVDYECRQGSTQHRAGDLRLFTNRLNPPALKVSARVAAEHDRIYGLLENLLTPAQRAVLAASERTWLNYRRAACTYASAGCATTLTRTRIEELKYSWPAERFW